MMGTLPHLQGPQITFLPGGGLPAQIQEAAQRRRRASLQAVFAPAVSRARESGREVWIFGAGETGRAALQEARLQGLPIQGFIDSDPALAGSTVDGLPVLDFEGAYHRGARTFLVALRTEGADVCRALSTLGEDGVFAPDGRELLWSFQWGPVPAQSILPFGIECFNARELRGFCPPGFPLAEVALFKDGREAGRAFVAQEPPGSQDRMEFRCLLAGPLDPGPACTLEALFTSLDGATVRLIHAGQFPGVLPMREAAFVPERDQPFGAPFPHGVALALHRLRPGTYPREGTWDDATLAAAVADIRALDEDLAPAGPIHAYLGFLRSLATRFRFIHRRFPRFNPGRAGDLFALDALAGATSYAEVLAIAHHLYVLRSYGLEGTLGEFGCYKGLSTCMLSLACRETGFRLAVFDSFQGLPAASLNGLCQPGEFQGSLREVQDRVEEFGAPECVSYHPGFFSDSLREPPVLPSVIWADVDLATSMADVLGPLFASLPRISCVFSHELSEASLNGEGPAPFQELADEVLGPLVGAFRAAGRPVTLRNMAGFTSAFWETGRGVPALPWAAIEALLPEPVVN